MPGWKSICISTAVVGTLTAAVALGVALPGGQSDDVEQVVTDASQVGAATGMIHVVKDPTPPDELNIRGTSELQCATGFMVADSINHSGAEGASRAPEKVAMRAPERIADGYARENSKNLADSKGRPPTRATFTYDRADPSDARKVRIEYRTEEDATTGVLVAEKLNGIGWLVQEAIACSDVVPKDIDGSNDEEVRRKMAEVQPPA